MIFKNPSGAPELACTLCGCRWVDRTNGSRCYECGSEISEQSVTAFQRALELFSSRNASVTTTALQKCKGDSNE